MNTFTLTRQLWKQKFGEEYLEYKYKKKSTRTDSILDYGCLSCGFGDVFLHRGLPHNTSTISEIPSIDNLPEIGADGSLLDGVGDIGCLSCIGDILP